MTTAAPEQTGFELHRFQWADAERLEVEGRWFGVRGRRFVRPVLTVQVEGRRRRLLAMLEHKPWTADEGETWLAAFPWDGDQDSVGAAELEVGALTVELPPPSGAVARELTSADDAVEEHGDAPALRAAGETRLQLERDLAGARAELGRLRARHEEEIRDLRAREHSTAERLRTLRDRSDRDARRADALAGEASRLREELERVRAGQGEQVARMGEAEADARAELERERERAAQAASEAERLRAAEAGTAAEADRLQAERRGAESELAELREAHEQALAEINKLRQAARRSAAEVERLRAASRRPGGRLPEPPPARAADPDATGAVQSEEGEPPRPAPTFPSKPGPAVRRIPRAPAGPPAAAEPPAPAAGAEPPAPAEPLPPRARPDRDAGTVGLLSPAAQHPYERRAWGPRVVALLLVALLLVALALLVIVIL